MPDPTADAVPVIELHDVALCYRLGKQRIHSFKEYFVNMVRGGLSYHELWALDGIDLTVHRGESVGICGHNGAGKSTLSKLVSGIFKPTRGTRIVRGRVAPILELGIGFDPELTGIENIYMNSLFFGHRRREVEERLDAIVEFSGLGDFVESPVRNYSTGMTARLAFSIATAWVPDVLILDEVLAVGDARFLQRCHDRIAEFREQGATTLIVSHSPTAILDNCTRAIWIDRGQKRADGAPDEVLELYAESDRPGRVVPEEETVAAPRL